MDCDKESGDMFGTCKNCGCHLDADKEGIWGVNLLENKNSANEEEE